MGRDLSHKTAKSKSHDKAKDKTPEGIKGRILFWAILIFIDIVIRIFYPSMFMGLSLITRIFSYIILAVLPIEMIAFNSFLVKKQNGMAIEYF